MKDLNKGEVRDNIWVEDDPVKSRKAWLDCKYYVDDKVAIEISFANENRQKKEHIERKLARPSEYVKFYYRLNNQFSKRRLARYQDEIMYSKDITLEELKLKCLIKAKDFGWNIKKIFV